MKAVIDSDVLIDFLQGDRRAAEEIDRYDDLRYSVISWMEVMCGADTEPEKAAAKGLLESMRAVELSSGIAHLAVEARRKHRLKLPDAVIWATADSEGCILVTRNTKDFDKDHPMIRIPY
jgi:predicted nucleic acid-binding protein